MTIEKYQLFEIKIKKDFANEYNQAKLDLENSKSKKKDYRIIQKFFDHLYEHADETYDEMFDDHNAMLPMPTSVSKQMAVRLFKPKYLNPLWDMGIYEGFY